MWFFRTHHIFQNQAYQYDVNFRGDDKNDDRDVDDF